MNRNEKTAQIAEIKSRFDRAISVTLLDFQGLTVQTVTDLRRQFRKAGIEYKVVKNTLIRHALKDSAYKTLAGDLTETRANRPKAHAALRGMTGVAWSYDEPKAAVKVLESFKKEKADKAEKLKYKTGMVSGALIDQATLGAMPGLKDTQGMIVGMLDAPAANIYMMLVVPAMQIVAILDTWEAKRKEAGEQ